MDLTSDTLREAQFREKRGGYHPGDVDHLLEEVAAGVDELHERLRQAVERAQRAEAAAATATANAAANTGDAAESNETLKRTLVLAQRTADMAVQEAREQANQIVTSAKQQAQAMVSEAEERGRRAYDDALANIRTELSNLEVVRSRGQQEVDTLNRWVDEHRSHLAAALREALGIVEGTGTLPPAPSSHPINLDARPADSGSSVVPPASPAPANPGPGTNLPAGGGAESAAPAGASSGPPTVAWQVPPDQPVGGGEGGEVSFGGPLRRAGDAGRPGEPEGNGGAGGAPSNGGGARHASSPRPAADPDDEGMDEFFDDDDEFDDAEDGDHRFGGRLRRRR